MLRDKEIAKERIQILFQKALEEAKKGNLELANRYIYILWKIKLKFHIKLPKYIKRMFCRKCLTFWIPEKTLRVRVRNGRVIYTCLKCGRIYRFPIVKVKNKNFRKKSEI